MTAGEKSLLIPVCVVMHLVALSWRFFFIALGAVVLIAAIALLPCEVVGNEDC